LIHESFLLYLQPFQLQIPHTLLTPIDDYDQLGHLMCSHPLHPFYYLEHLHHMIPHRHRDMKYEQHNDVKTPTTLQNAIYDD
jgi:hypothetical protein